MRSRIFNLKACLIFMVMCKFLFLFLWWFFEIVYFFLLSCQLERCSLHFYRSRNASSPLFLQTFFIVRKWHFVFWSAVYNENSFSLEIVTKDCKVGSVPFFEFNVHLLTSTWLEGETYWPNHHNWPIQGITAVILRPLTAKITHL